MLYRNAKGGSKGGPLAPGYRGPLQSNYLSVMYVAISTTNSYYITTVYINYRQIIN